MLVALLIGGSAIPATMDPAAIPDYQVLRPGLAVAGQPTAEALGRLKRQGFRTVIDLSLQGQGLADERAIVEAKGLRYVWIPVMTEGFHEHDAIAVGQFMLDGAAGPLLVHGSTSDGAGAVWAVLQAQAGHSQEEALEEGRRAGLKSEEMVEAVRRVVQNLRGDLAPCLGCTDQMPRMIQNARPEYPQDAFLKNIQGIVEFDVLIDGTGRVVHARIIKSIPKLDSAARRCILQWKFSPGTRRGHPVVVRVNAPVAFRIYDEWSGTGSRPKKQ